MSGSSACFNSFLNERVRLWRDRSEPICEAIIKPVSSFRAFDHEAFDSVYIGQEVCHQACKQQGVYSTQDTLKTIGADLDVQDLVK